MLTLAKRGVRDATGNPVCILGFGLIQPKEDNAPGLVARLDSLQSREQYHLCAVLFRIVFIMTRLNLVEGTDEFFIAGLAMKVRSELGFSMLESTYERALMIELKNAGFPAERQVGIPVFYSGETLSHGYAADIIVDNRILLELKAASRLYSMHRRQIQFYLCASGIQSGLLINFGNPKTIECERYEWIDSGYRINPDAVIISPKTGSLEERVNQVLGNDTILGGNT